MRSIAKKMEELIVCIRKPSELPKHRQTSLRRWSKSPKKAFFRPKIR